MPSKARRRAPERYARLTPWRMGYFGTIDARRTYRIAPHMSCLELPVFVLSKQGRVRPPGVTGAPALLNERMRAEVKQVQAIVKVIQARSGN